MTHPATKHAPEQRDNDVTDALGTRAVVAVLLPATNTMVEPDMASLQAPGVTNHAFRFPFPELPTTPDHLLQLMAPAVHMVPACEPDHVVLGYSPEYLPNAASVAATLKAELQRASGLDVTTATDAVLSALRTLECSSLGIVNPFPESAVAHVIDHFTSEGFHVAAVQALASAQKGKVFSGRITAEEIRSAFRAADTDEVDGLLQVGTNLVATNLVDELEQELGKPVVAVNTATYWHALRSMGIEDSLPGFGSLMRTDRPPA